MPNRSKQKGDRWERECRDILELQGYFVTKAGGSLGMFDLIAIGNGKTRCIQCRCNNWFKDKQERREMEQLRIENLRVIVELWRKDDRKPAPLIKTFFPGTNEWVESPHQGE